MHYCDNPSTISKLMEMISTIINALCDAKREEARIEVKRNRLFLIYCALLQVKHLIPWRSTAMHSFDRGCNLNCNYEASLNNLFFSSQCKKITLSQLRNVKLLFKIILQFFNFIVCSFRHSLSNKTLKLLFIIIVICSKML